ncbi:MAG: N-acetylmuramidase family protein [Rhodobacteraceae bacterium]|nr:N-acetylmuramidase family protein [Paracoccaceae bacterium]
MSLFGTGPAKALGKWELPRLAIELNLHPAKLAGIRKAESGGFGWFPDGRIKKLPEPHVFRRELPASKRAEAKRQGLTSPSYKATRASGHYRRMRTANDRYNFFERMRAIDENAAFRSCSWGSYQIMGNEHKRCGYSSAKAMVEDFLQGEKQQLIAFGNFLKSKGIVGHLRAGRYYRSAELYNGKGNAATYSKIIRDNVASFMRGKWKNWDPKSVPAETTDPVKTDDTSTDTETSKGTFTMWATLLQIGLPLIAAMFPGSSDDDKKANNPIVNLFRSITGLFGVDMAADDGGLYGLIGQFIPALQGLTEGGEGLGDLLSGGSNGWLTIIAFVIQLIIGNMVKNEEKKTATEATTTA